MDKTKKILVTTLGASWQIIPEIVGWTNPAQYDFFRENTDVSNLRTKHDICPVDEFWIVTTGQQKDIDKLKKWIEQWKIEVKYFVCLGINDFQTENDITKFRSLLFRVVLKAKEITNDGGKLYLSLTGGRKTMSADMYESGILFGCDILFHIMDANSPKEQKDDDLLSDCQGQYAKYYFPIVIGEKIESNFIVSAGDKRIISEDYPIDIFQSERNFEEDGKLAAEITHRKEQSSQIYSNFYQHIRSQANERDIFRHLYFLHPDVLRKLKEIKIGFDYDRDMKILRMLPKADLHTHLGGVLTAAEIIQVAKAVNCEELKNKSEKFQNHIKEILKYENNENGLDKHIFGNYTQYENFYKINIDPYQELGNYQGSALLQTKETIAKTIEIYTKKLISDNVKYVEIRCSPYKYTKEGLNTSEVVDTIIDTIDKIAGNDKIRYRLIYIIGRQSSCEEIKSSVDEIMELLEKNLRFAEKLAGIDLAGNEAYNNPEKLRENFMPFLKKCIHITIHAGETERADNIWEAVYHLSADRIGHGLKLLEREEMIPQFIDKNIGIEMCPSSNRQIVGYGKPEDEIYPLKKYLEKGLKVTVNTDNQGISRTSMSNEYFEAAKLSGGLSLWNCFVLIRNSIIVSFSDHQTKKQMLQEYEREIFDWCNREVKQLTSE